MAKTISLENKIIYGGDYNPEQWLHMPEILEKDIEMFKKAGINEVTMGVFSWSVLEKTEGDYNLDWLCQRVEELYKNGIYTILATPSGAIPRWLGNKYPEVLRVEKNGVRNIVGLRHNFCPTSPVFREKTRLINTRLAEKLGNHPGVIGWHISNEFGGDCYCPSCQRAFRNWLRDRYDNDIEKLNSAWYTTFWSRRYSSFDEIDAPSEKGETRFQALDINWRRFETFIVGQFADHEIKAIRDAHSDKPCTTNFMYDFGGYDYKELGTHFDTISWDDYPNWHKHELISTALDEGLQHDFMRCILKKPFLVMESAPSDITWMESCRIKKPGILKLSSLNAIAHGADSVQYFQLRQARGATEKFMRGVIDHYGGEDTRVFGEVSELGDILGKLGEIAGAQTNSRVALVYDRQSCWGIEISEWIRQEIGYRESVQKAYRGIKKCHLNVDVIDVTDNISEYDLVISPMTYMYRSDFEKKVKTFVENGGYFVTGYMSGIADEDDLCYLGGVPYGLMEVLGLRREETDALYDGEQNCIIPVANRGMIYSCEKICDIVKTDTATPLYTYGEDFYRGTPAVTVNDFGKGKAFYIAADMEEGFYTDFFKYVTEEKGIPGIVSGSLPGEVQVSSRKKNGDEYIFIQNYTERVRQLECDAYSGMIQPLETIIIKNGLRMDI